MGSFFQRLRRYFFTATLGVMGALVSPLVVAHCPLCTGAMGVAAVGAKYLGFDITFVGAFVGAFGISSGAWIARKIKRKFFFGQTLAIILGSFLLTVIPLMPIDDGVAFVPLFLAGGAGTLLNKVYFVDKLLFGSLFGAILAFVAWRAHETIKLRYGRVFIPFQGTLLTLFSTLLAAIPLQLYFGGQA